MSIRLKSLILALAAGSFIAVVVFLALPAMIYAGNASEFEWPIHDILKVYALYATGLVAVTCLLAVLLPGRFGLWWASACAALAMYVWAYGNFVIYDFGLLDGQHWSLDAPWWKTALELGLIPLGLIAAFLIARAKPVIMAGAMVVLAGGNILTVWPVLTKVAGPPAETVDQAAFYSFSKSKNVLVVLLDAMQSDVFDEVISENPAIASSFKGFNYYPDTAGVAPTTYLSIPAIHSGIEYDRTSSMKQYYKTAVREGSFLNRLAAGGYHATMVNPVMNICPEKTSLCTLDATLLGGQKETRAKNIADLMDLTLLRVAPLLLKPAVYNHGRWIVGALIRDPRLIHFSLRGNSLMVDLAGKLTVSAPQPTVKFLHLFSTHLPVVLNERCEYAAETIVFSRETYKAQVRCGLTAFGTLLDALQKAGVYDQTAIALLADHGTTGIISPRAAPTTIAAANLVSIANPTFAFKPLGAGGAMKRVDQPISLADMTSIICADVGDCPTPRKVPDTHRNFNFYRWSQAFWTSEAPPVITAYKITGQPMWDGALWQREMSPVALGEKIDFTSTGDTARYRGTGWANPESWGIWTVGNTAELSFGLSAAPQDLLLDLDTQGFPTADGVQAATVLANDMKVGTLSYDTKTLFQQSTFKIPAEIVRNGGGVLRVTLAVEKPTSPKSLGQSVDTRELGIGLHWMKLRGANDGS